jgi:hypothetical protein
VTDRIELNDDRTLNEIVVGAAHLEQLDDGHWFLSMGRHDGSSVAVWLWSDTPITVTYEKRDAGNFWKDQNADDIIAHRLRRAPHE